MLYNQVNVARIYMYIGSNIDLSDQCRIAITFTFVINHIHQERCQSIELFKTL